MIIARRFNGGNRSNKAQFLAAAGQRAAPAERLCPALPAVIETRTNQILRRSQNPLQSLPMSHRYESLLVHGIFSTKNRKPLIAKDVRPRLWAYIGGICRTNGFKALAVGGVEDHVHILLSLPATLTVAKAIQLIKGGSSKWMNDKSDRRSFAWQDSYGAFTIGISQVEETVRYINNQERHHLKVRFEDEFRKILERHGIKEFRG